MKKNVLAIMVIMVAVLTLSSCAGGTVEEITLFEDTVKTVYSVDEEFPKNAKISVRYKNGKTETVSIGLSDNVTGFDTAISGTRTMTINYGGKSLSVEYNVKGNVNTRARVCADADFSDGGVKIILRLSGLDTLTAPLYAIRITVRYAADKLGEVVLKTAADGWTHESVESVGTVSALFYDPNAERPISRDGAFAEIELKKIADFSETEIYFSGGYAGYEEIDASDGEELLFMPAFGIGYCVIED